MRTRLALLLALVLAVSISLVPFGTASASDRVFFAQEGGGDPTGEGDAQQGQEGSDTSGEGQGEPGAETGAGEGEQAPAEEETGPVWTYQMSRISLGLLVLLLLAIGGAYWSFVAKRQKQGI